MRELSQRLLERFWAKVDVKGEDDCWEWQAYIVNGYGQFSVSEKLDYAHRVSWRIVNGPIPKGKLILHKCDNRKCVNPKHLYCGTYGDNNMDRAKRNLFNRGGGQLKLHEGEIWLIRKLCIPVDKGMYLRHQRYKFSASYVSKMFKVSRSTILRIWNSDKYLCREGYYA